jgi:hypothetical protein
LDDSSVISMERLRVFVSVNWLAVLKDGELGVESAVSLVDSWGDLSVLSSGDQ